MNKELKQKYTEMMENIEKYDDFDKESAHIEGDAILCILLRELGYEEVVEAWERIPKWYA